MFQWAADGGVVSVGCRPLLQLFHFGVHAAQLVPARSCSGDGTRRDVGQLDDVRHGILNGLWVSSANVYAITDYRHWPEEVNQYL